MRDIVRKVISRWVPDGQTGVGRVLRWPLRAIPADAVFRVLTGPNQGFQWVVWASVHGCWIGSYERAFADRLWSRLSVGDVFYDIGANVGYYTLLGARAVGPGGKVVAFEPHPRNLTYLQRHLELNEIKNVEVVQVALLDRKGEVTLSSEGGPSQARVSEDGSAAVPGRTLDSLTLPAPDIVKMDVEGAEADVLRGGEETLQEHQPVVLFSTHSAEARQESYDLLGRMGYQVRALQGQNSDHIAVPGR